MSKPKKASTPTKNPAAAILGALRWNDVTPAERTRHAKAMLAARWAKHHKPKKVSPKEKP